MLVMGHGRIGTREIITYGIPEFVFVSNYEKLRNPRTKKSKENSDLRVFREEMNKKIRQSTFALPVYHKRRSY